MSLCRLPFLVYCSNALFLKSTSGIAPGKMATIQWTQKCVPRGIKRIFLRLIWVVSTGWVCLILTGNVCHQKRILFFAAKSQLVEGGKKNTTRSQVLLSCVRPSSPVWPAPLGEQMSALRDRPLQLARLCWRGLLRLQRSPAQGPWALNLTVSLARVTFPSRGCFPTLKSSASASPLPLKRELLSGAGPCFAPFCIHRGSFLKA